MAGIKFDITGDNQHFINSLTETRNAVRTTTKEIESQGVSIEKYFSNLKSAAMAAAAGFSAKQFINQMMQVRGEFQKLEVAFTTMLGNEEKAVALMDQLTKTAAITPFDLQGVTNGAKQLLAYGVEAEKVNDTLIHLGDIAAGLSLPLNDLVYLYGTTMTQGRMVTQDLRQFQGRGIPIAEELAKAFNTTKDKVGELVTAGMVGAKEFNQAIMAMSSEGGKFAGLMEAQSKTITGQISNIEDAVQSMLNNMGKQSEGIINGALEVVSSLVDNYQKVGEAIGGVAATYGLYKAAIITTTALNSIQAAGVGALTAAEAAHYGWLVVCEKAQALLNKTMLANPYVLAATALAGLVAVMVTMKGEQERVNEAYDEYNSKKSDIIRKEEEHKARIEELARVAGDESLSTDTRRLALVELEQKYPAIFAKYDTEAEKLRHIRDLKAEIAALDGKNSITSASNELGNLEKRIRELQGIHADYFLNSAGQRTYTGRNRTDDEEAELKALQRRRRELTNEIRKDMGKTYLTNLTGVSNEDLKKQIDERRNLLARMDLEGKRYGRTTRGGVTGVYSKDELQGQLQILESEQNRRKQVLEDSAKDFVKEADKAYKKEHAALRQLESLTDPKKRASSKQEIDGKKVSEMSGDEFLAAVEKQQKAVDEAKKKVDAYRKASTSGTDTNDSRRRQQLFEADQKETERQAQQRRTLEEAVADAELAGIASDAEREMRERDLQHSRKIQQIRDQADEWKKAAYKAAEERFNAANADKSKTFADTEEGKAGWQAQTLTQAQTKAIEIQIQAENAVFDRETKKRLWQEERANANAVNSYLRQYGDYAQKKQAIYDEANDKICEYEEELSQATTEEAKAAAQARINIVKEETNEQIKELDVQYGKAKKFMVDLFEETAHKSVGELQEIIDKYKALLKFLKGDSSVSRQMLKNIGFSDGQIDEALKNAKEKGVEFFKTISDGIKNIEGDVSNMSVWQKLKKKMEEASKAFEKDATTDPKKQGVAMSELAEVAEEAIPIFSDLASEMLGAFNIDDSSLKQATQSLASFAQLANSIGKIKSGDKLNGVLGIASVVFSVGSTIFNAIQQEKEVERQKAISIVNHTLELTNERLQTLNDTLQKSYGIEALELSAKAQEEVSRRNAQAVEGLKKSQMVDSNEWGLGWQWNVLAKIVGDLYNLDYGEDRVEDFGYGWKGSMWEDILNNTSVDRLVEVFSDIKRNSLDIWANLLSIRDSDVEDFLNTLVASEEEINNISETLKQQLTTTTEQNIFDSFLDSLYNLADGSEDVFDDIAENWQKMVNKMVVNNLVGNSFQEKLNVWYDDLATAVSKRSSAKGDKEAMKAANKEFQATLDDLKERYEGYMSAAQEEMEVFKEMGIVQSSTEVSATSQNQSASVQAMERINTDQAEELIGRMNAGQMLWQQGNDQRTLILQGLQTMQDLTSSNGGRLTEMVTLMQTANSHLLSLYENNKKSYVEFGEKLDRIARGIEKI